MTQEADYAQYKDDEVIFYYDTLPKGTYDFYFRLKASIAGSFVHPPAKAEMMYRETVRVTLMAHASSLNLIKIKGLKFNAENTKRIRGEKWKGRRLVPLSFHPPI